MARAQRREAGRERSTGAGRASTGARISLKARVLIRPKQGILDPQGQAVQRALPALGFEAVEDVRVGRMVELELRDPGRLDEMCERLLANPLIEDYEILLEERAEAAP